MFYDHWFLQTFVLDGGQNEFQMAVKMNYSLFDVLVATFFHIHK